MRAFDRSAVRYTAAAVSALVAVIYLLIGLGVISVVTDQEAGLVPPLLVAGVVFGLLAVVTTVSSKTLVWIVGAGLQVLVIVGYLAISSERTPAFESWGILLKLLQVSLLIAFVYLAVLRASRPVRGGGLS